MRTGAVVAAAVMVLGAARAQEQEAVTAPHFEVASVKPIDLFAELRKGGAGGGGGPIAMPFTGVRVQPGGRVMAVATLRMLILTAHGIKDYQLEGGPKWLATDYFDIVAKAEKETATEAELNAMLKSLLADRFGLSVHVETRQVTVHTLTVARADGKLGSGLKPTSQECETTLEERKRTGARPPSLSGRPQPMAPICGLTTMSLTPRNVATFAMGGQPMSVLIERISSDLGATVVDATSLSGLFDAAVEYEAPARYARRQSGLDPNSTDPLPVPLPAALQQQLGLKLEKGTGPLAITIVDAAEPPSAN